ncbi:MAG TPA: low affinity iron permease family protein [Bauldia sp.]|nr:low affinity iron permease family protein [Bauldia sp.]
MPGKNQGRAKDKGPSAIRDRFEDFSASVARLSGRPGAFVAAAGLVVVWAMTGPFVGFSDTWQLVINTGTTVITFLMVFLIQHTQNRDTLALQIKVAELLVALKGADTALATAEDLDEASLEDLHARYKTVVREGKGNGRRRARRKPRGGTA